MSVIYWTGRHKILWRNTNIRFFATRGEYLEWLEQNRTNLYLVKAIYREYYPQGNRSCSAWEKIYDPCFGT